MAEASQFKFDLKEIGKMLLEKEGITTGKWSIGVGFNAIGAEAGPSPEVIRPSLIVAVDHFLLTSTTVDGPLVITAAPKGKKVDAPSASNA